MSQPATPPRTARVPGVGETIHGKYRVESVLGSGGMGVVVLARHLGLDEKVAIKFLSENVALEPRTVERFLREGRAAVKIRGEHVARMMDVGTLDDGSPFLVMEHLEGRELAAVLREDGPLAAEPALSVVMQTCEALAEAHALGIVHRDLKPANLFLDFRPDRSVRVKVLDFGISKSSFDTPSATTSSQVMGTPQYMSPEQLNSPRDVEPRTDIWSLGVILYELVSGRHPFAAPTVYKIFSNILDHPPTPLRQHVPAVSPAIEGIVGVCLEKDPARRYPDVAALAQALAEAGAPDGTRAAERVARILWASGRQTAPPPPPTPRTSAPQAEAFQGATIAFGVTEPAPLAALSGARPRRSPATPWIVGAGGLAVLAAVGIVALRAPRWPGHGPSTSATGAPPPRSPEIAGSLPPPSISVASSEADSTASATAPAAATSASVPPKRVPRRRPPTAPDPAAPAPAPAPAPARTSEDRR